MGAFMIILDQIFKNEIAKVAQSYSRSAIQEIVQAHQARFDYIIRVLTTNNQYGRPDLDLQRAIRDAAIADASDSLFPQQLAAILTAWLSPALQGTGTPNSAYAATRKREAFLAAFTRRSQNAIGALNFINDKHIWSWNLTL